MASPRKKVCIIAPVPVAFTAFLAPHIHALRQRYEVNLVSSESSDALRQLCGSDIGFHQVLIPRGISIIADLKALIGLWRHFRHQRFAAVHSVTPKGGLVAMIAASLANPTNETKTLD